MAQPSVASLFLKDSTATFAAELTTGGASFVAGVLIARAVGPDGKGALALITTGAALGSTLLSLRWDRAAGYFLARGIAPVSAVVGTQLLVSVLAGAASMSVWLVMPQLFSSYLLRGLAPELTLVASALVFTHTLTVALTTFYSGTRAFLARAFYVSAISASLLISNAALFICGVHTAAIYAIAYAGFWTSITVAWFTVLLYHRGIKPRIDVRVARDMLRYSYVTYVTVVLDLMTLRADMLILNYMWGTSEVGLYSIAVGLSSQLTRVPNIVSTILFHRGAAGEAGSPLTTARILRMTFLLVCAPAALIGLCARPLIYVLYGSAFARAVLPLLMLLPAAAFWGSYRITAAYLESRGSTRTVSVCSLLTATTIIVLDFAWIPRGGATGAAAASLAGYAVAFVTSSFMFSRLAEVSLWQVCVPTRHDFTSLPRLFRAHAQNSDPANAFPPL